MRSRTTTLLAALIAFGTVSLGVAAQNAARPDIDARVDVGGYKLQISCTGQGSPTVVLDAGLGGDSRTWQKLKPQIGAFTRVCAYDRANLGRSDPPSRDVRRIESRTFIELRSGGDAVRDLHTLLTNAKETGPYVLVGHSFGGLVSMMYAAQYPNDVVGMVLVDSVHPDQARRLTPLMTPEEAQVEQSAALQNREGFDLNQVLDEARATDWRSNIPLMVLAQGRPESPATERSTREGAIWRAMQEEHARRSPNGRLIIAEKSGHNIHNDEPGLVVTAIRDVVDLAKANTRQ